LTSRRGEAALFIFSLGRLAADLGVEDAVVAPHRLAADVAVQEIAANCQALALRRRTEAARTWRAHVDERAGGGEVRSVARQCLGFPLGGGERHRGGGARLAPL